MTPKKKTAPVEVQFAQKLAANEPKVRDRAVKKLRKWLSSRTTMDEDEMMKIWKGLHYCFWMSDKPLIQEELAENIGAMIHCFSKAELKFLFIQCCFVTIGREWVGLDRWRMDKFMMFVRRFLRQVFAFAATEQWKDEIIQGLTDLFKTRVISANKDGIVNMKVALGFQLHFVDIFLEELAKIGGEDLDSSVINAFLQPFVDELAAGQEERLKDDIEVRIFQHLMRQSDIGIAYEEDDGESVEDENEEEGSDEEPVAEENGKDDEEMEVGSDEEMLGVKDPRAGKVDVTLPQLQVDFEHMAEVLFGAGSDKKVSKSNRNRLYRLTKNFKDIAKGLYPLAAELSDDEEEPEQLNFKKLAKSFAQEEFENAQKIQEEKRKYREALRLKAEKARAQEEEANNEDSTEDLAGSEEDEVVEVPKVEEKKSKKKKRKHKDKTEEEGVVEELKEEDPKPKKKKKKHLKETAAEEAVEEAVKDPEPKEKKLKKKKQTEEVVGQESKGELKKSKKKRKHQDKTDAENDTPKKAKLQSMEIPEDLENVSAFAIRKMKMSPVQADVSSKKKNKKKKDKKSKLDESTDSAMNALKSETSEKPSQSIEAESEKSVRQKPVDKEPEKPKKEKKKKKKKKKAPSEPVEPEPEKPKEDKKKKKNNVPSENGDAGSVTDVDTSLWVGSNNQSQISNEFEESNDWNEPLKEGETEILMPNKKYKGKEKLKETPKAKEAKDTPPEKGLNGFSAPTISATPPQSATPLFVRKAISKSAAIDDKKVLKGKKKRKDNLNASLPVKQNRRLNFAISKNKVTNQSLLDESMTGSPDIPFSAEKKASRGILKRTDSPVITPSGHSVQHNTKINGRSKAMKILMGTREGKNLFWSSRQNVRKKEEEKYEASDSSDGEEG